MDLQFTILLGVLIIFILIGYIRGLIKSIIKVVLTILTFIIAYSSLPLASQIIIDQTEIDDKIEIVILDKIKTETKNAFTKAGKDNSSEINKYLDDAEINLSDKDVDKFINENITPNRNQQMEIIESISMPEFMKKNLIEKNSKEFMKKIGANNFYEYIAKYISQIIVKIVAFIVIFAFLSVISMIIYFAAGGLAKLPILHGVDKIAGAVFGMVEGLIVCVILILVFDCATSVMINVEEVKKKKEKTIVEKICQQDMVEDVINKIIRIE